MDLKEASDGPVEASNGPEEVSYAHMDLKGLTMFRNSKVLKETEEFSYGSKMPLMDLNRPLMNQNRSQRH